MTLYIESKIGIEYQITIENGMIVSEYKSKDTPEIAILRQFAEGASKKGKLSRVYILKRSNSGGLIQKLVG